MKPKTKLAVTILILLVSTNAFAYALGSSTQYSPLKTLASICIYPAPATPTPQPTATPTPSPIISSDCVITSAIWDNGTGTVSAWIPEDGLTAIFPLISVYSDRNATLSITIKNKGELPISILESGVTIKSNIASLFDITTNNKVLTLGAKTSYTWIWTFTPLFEAGTEALSVTIQPEPLLA